MNALLNDEHVLNMIAAIPKEKIVSLYVVIEQGVNVENLSNNTWDNEVSLEQEVHVAQSLNWDDVFIDWNNGTLDQ